MENTNLIQLPTSTFAQLYAWSSRLHWLKIGEDGVPELYLDHHMMSTYRMCPARFAEEMIYGRAPVGTMPWSLEFGILVHSCLEYYYQNFRKPNFAIKNWLAFSVNLWHKGNFELFKDSKGYKNVGGPIGFSSLLMKYALRYGSENEHLRVVGTELYFGKAKEVPLLEEPTSIAPFRLYLCGKIDLIIDNGFAIAPMDHKTHGDFRGKDPNSMYEIQDGMTGYVYANRQLVRSLGIDDFSRKTNVIIMNHIQVKPADTLVNQFSRMSMMKTEWQLQSYRLRQISTATDIYNLLLGLSQGLEPYYNTGVCFNWWHNECIFAPLHRLNSADGQKIVAEKTYKIKPIWNPEDRDNLLVNILP